MKKILILENDIHLRQSLEQDFRDHDYEVCAISSLAQVPQNGFFDFALVDLRLNDGELGIDAVSEIHRLWPNCRIVILTGYGSITTAVETLKRGAFEYLTKPASFEKIQAAFDGIKKETSHNFKVLSLSEVEHEHIDLVLMKNKGNITQTAKDLGLHRQSLQRKLKKYT